MIWSSNIYTFCRRGVRRPSKTHLVPWAWCKLIASSRCGSSLPCPKWRQCWCDGSDHPLEVTTKCPWFWTIFDDFWEVQRWRLGAVSGSSWHGWIQLRGESSIVFMMVEFEMLAASRDAVSSVAFWVGKTMNLAKLLVISPCPGFLGRTDDFIRLKLETSWNNLKRSGHVHPCKICKTPLTQKKTHILYDLADLAFCSMMYLFNSRFNNERHIHILHTNESVAIASHNWPTGKDASSGQRS